MTRLALRRAVAWLALVVPLSAGAQVRASEKASVSQVADGTTFSLTYFRPQARGRTNLFGRVVHFGETWTPGANWATILEVSRDVQLDGHAVPKGKYSMWFVVRERAWTLILDPRWQRFHTETPDSTAKQLRWTVTPAVAPFTEVLTWSFPEVRADGMVLQFAWGERRVRLNATVTPSHPIPIARADAAPYVGRYTWRWAPGSGEDTVTQRTVEFTHDGTMLRQQHTPAPSWYPRVQGQPMVRIADDWFITAIIIDGKVWEMDADMVWEFTVREGRAVSFEIRDSHDFLLATGSRVPGR